MRSNRGPIDLLGSRWWTATLIAVGVVTAACLFALASEPTAEAGVPSARSAEHFACSPHSAAVPCHFSTPSGNIRCLWSPTPERVACELLATRRAYRLHPSGKAIPIDIQFHRLGDTLPTNQQLVFPHSLSCHDTTTTMTCNQDFGFGFFKLALGHSRSG